MYLTFTAVEVNGTVLSGEQLWGTLLWGSVTGCSIRTVSMKTDRSSLMLVGPYPHEGIQPPQYLLAGLYSPAQTI